MCEIRRIAAGVSAGSGRELRPSGESSEERNQHEMLVRLPHSRIAPVGQKVRWNMGKSIIPAGRAMSAI
jgi:hypothetical protein